MIKILKNKEELELGFALRIKVFVKEQMFPIELELDEKIIAKIQFIWIFS